MWIVGEYTSRLAENGWLDVPESLRIGLQEGSVLTRGLERCVLLFPATAWERFMGQFHAREPFGRLQSRRLARHIIGGASHEEPGDRSRVQLQEGLRVYGSLNDEVVLVGVGTHVEIWNPTAWATHLEQVLQHAEEDAEALALPPG